jgi:ABC-type nickel/cobalt efflux system permease component RcnA
MQPLLTRDWQKALWKIVRNPAFEVVAAILVVLLAAWIVVQSETDIRQPVFPVPFGHTKTS